MRNINQREMFPCEMRNFCERERLRDKKYLGAGDRERGGTLAGGGGDWRGRCGWHQGKRDRGESDDEGEFPCAMSRANLKNKNKNK